MDNTKQLKKSLQMSQGGSIVIPEKTKNNDATLVQKFAVTKTPIILPVHSDVNFNSLAHFRNLKTEKSRFWPIA